MGHLPRRKSGTKKGKKPSTVHAKKLWAVLIIETFNTLMPSPTRLTSRGSLRPGIGRSGLAADDPADQSEDAKVFGYIVPNFKELTSLEQQIAVPAKRIYDSISATWPEASILTEEPAAIGARDLRASRVDDQGLAFHIRA